MQTVTHAIALVKALRGVNANDDPRRHCECGKFCPLADACMPRVGEIHQPFYTIAERGGEQSTWSVILHDPQKNHTYPLSTKAFTSPCQAALAAAKLSGHQKSHPVRIAEAHQFCKSQMNWVALEERTAQTLYDAGVDLWLRTSFGMVGRVRFEHPLIELGYQAAMAEANAVIDETDSLMSKGEGMVWVLPAAAEVGHD